MNTIENAELIDTPSNAIALRPSMAVGQALGVDEIVAQVKLIQDVMHRVMVENEHYGCVPGCGPKKVLLQPGAQKLTMTFRLAPAYEIQEVNLERGHKEYRVICTLKNMGSGSFVGQGVGCCSSMESKYRWRTANKHCPNCGKETVFKSKKDNGWFCWSKKGGCGANFEQGSPVAIIIDSQEAGRMENENPADTFNTVLKMAKKRAFVDATITATAASDIFTQDVGDDSEGEEEQPKAPSKPVAPKFTSNTITPVQTVKTPPRPLGGSNLVGSVATPEQKSKLISTIEAEGPDAVQKALGYMIEVGALLPTESLKDLELRWIPATAGQFRELGLLIAKLNDTGVAEKPAWAKLPEPNLATAFNAEEGEESPFQDAREAAETEPAQETLQMDDEKWRVFLTPYGKNEGVPLGKLPKNTLYGFWANHSVQTEYKGKPIAKEKIEKDRAFRAALDQAGVVYKFEHSK